MPDAQGQGEPSTNTTTEATHQTCCMRNVCKHVRRLLIVFLGILLLVRLTGYAERLAFWPSRRAFETPSRYEDVWFTTSDGVKLHGWFMAAQGLAEGEKAPVVLHCHGNRGNVSKHDQFSSWLPSHGISVLVFDYRCYGRSDNTGPLDRHALLVDANAALEYLLTRDDIDPDRIAAMGVSLGGAFALPLAADRPEIKALVSLSTFSTWQGVASDWVPILGPILLGPGDDPIDHVAGLGDRPWLILHGDADKVINVRHASILYEAGLAASVPVTRIIVPGAGHNDVLFVDPHAQQAVLKVLDEAF